MHIVRVLLPIKHCFFAMLDLVPTSRVGILLLECVATFSYNCVHALRSDILPVEDSSGKGALALISKHLDALGCPSWFHLVAGYKHGSYALIPGLFYCQLAHESEVLFPVL